MTAYNKRTNAASTAYITFEQIIVNFPPATLISTLAYLDCIDLNSPCIPFEAIPFDDADPFSLEFNLKGPSSGRVIINGVAFDHYSVLVFDYAY